MSAITFDTLKFVERLEQAGMPRAQAVALAEVQKDTFSQALETTLATKADITEVKSELALQRWMIGILIAIAIANFAKQFF